MRRRGPAAVTVLCLTAILLPLLTALAISEGLRSQAEIGIREGADLFIAADVGGAEGPLGAAHLERLRRVPGIVQAQARVVGRTYFGDHLVAVVGLEPASLQALKPLVTGRVPQSRGEVLLGRGLAREFGIDPGAAVPFSLAANRKKMLRVTGTLKPCCLWASRILLMDIADANEFFRLPGRSTQLLARLSPEAGSR